MNLTSLILFTVLGFALGYSARALGLNFGMLSDRIESITMEKMARDELITITYESGKVKKYRGGCTVWHEYPSGIRQGTMTESWLSDIWQREKWKRESQSS